MALLPGSVTFSQLSLDTPAVGDYNLTFSSNGKGLHSSTFHLNVSCFLSLKSHQTTRRIPHILLT